MLIVGVDPGSIMTGLALYDTRQQAFQWWSETDFPPAVWTLISDNLTATVVVEDFIGSGTLNNHRKRTIEILGFVYYICEVNRVKVVRAPPQARLAYVVKVPMAINGKDERSAAAHCLAYAAKHPEE